MRKLNHYTPRTRLARLLAPFVATAVSHLPPRALRPIAVPCVRWGRESRRPALRRRADRTINLIVGDGMTIRVNRRCAKER